eukprot:2845391-Rhodomonas_salina.1
MRVAQVRQLLRENQDLREVPAYALATECPELSTDKRRIILHARYGMSGTDLRGAPYHPTRSLWHVRY